MTSKFTLNQSDYHITSEGYLLNQIEEALSYRNMPFDRMNGNSLFYRQPFYRSLNRADILRTFEITIDVDEHRILFTLKTEIIVEVFLGFLIVCGFCFALLLTPIAILFILPLIPKLIGLTIKSVIISRIKNELISHFNQLKN